MLFAAGAVYAAPVPLTSIIGADGSGTAAPPDPVEGTWKTQDGSEINIARCDAGFCGTLSYIVVPKAYESQCEQADRATVAQAMRDEKNPDPALKTRSLLGLQMMKLTPTGDPTSFNLVVYNAQDGSTNNAQAFVMNDGKTLRVGGGCMGTMCVISQDWPRVADRQGPPDFTCKSP